MQKKVSWLHFIPKTWRAVLSAFDVCAIFSTPFLEFQNKCGLSSKHVIVVVAVAVVVITAAVIIIVVTIIAVAVVVPVMLLLLLLLLQLLPLCYCCYCCCWSCYCCYCYYYCWYCCCCCLYCCCCCFADIVLDVIAVSRLFYLLLTQSTSDFLFYCGLISKKVKLEKIGRKLFGRSWFNSPKDGKNKKKFYLGRTM